MAQVVPQHNHSFYLPNKRKYLNPLSSLMRRNRLKQRINDSLDEKREEDPFSPFFLTEEVPKAHHTSMNVHTDDLIMPR